MEAGFRSVDQWNARAAYTIVRWSRADAAYEVVAVADERQLFVSSSANRCLRVAEIFEEEWRDRWLDDAHAAAQTRLEV